MQLDIRNGRIQQKVFVNNGFDNIVHIYKHDDGGWVVSCGTRRDEFTTVGEITKVKTFMHGALVEEGISRFDLYADELVKMGVYLKEGNHKYVIHPWLKIAIETMDYLGGITPPA